MPKPQIKKRKTYNVRLSKFELLHLRDLFSIVLPPQANVTISQSLAQAEDRTHIEHILWNKISSLCVEADLPLGDEAPDYIIAPTAPPTLGVFQVASEPVEDMDVDVDEDEEDSE